jgi:DNA/RNA endonuclease YhcR with UshA esterase domain
LKGPILPVAKKGNCSFTQTFLEQFLGEGAPYVGKEVEVRGRVVSVTTSPLGTTFINFGGEYPNQTFAGFIAAWSAIAGDQRLTMIQGKTIGITGAIRLRDGKPEIEIVSEDQIKALDSQTERWG